MRLASGSDTSFVAVKPSHSSASAKDTIHITRTRGSGAVAVCGTAPTVALTDPATYEILSSVAVLSTVYSVQCTVYIHIHIHIHINIHIQIQIHIHIHFHTTLHYIYIYIHIFTYSHIYIFTYLHIYIFTYVNIYIFT